MRMGLGVRAVSSVWPYFWPYSSLLSRAARAKAYRSQEEPFCWLEWSLDQDICLLCKLEDSPYKPQQVKEGDSPAGTRRSCSVGDLSLGMKADTQLLVSDVLHNKRGAGIVKAGQETLWLQTRRHSSVPGPGEENSLFCCSHQCGCQDQTWVHMGGCNALLQGAGVEGERGAKRCCFCAIREGCWEGVKCQSVVMAFLPTCVVDMPAVLLTFP